ncbi:hypothetical protein EV421DRAFT_1902190 [Armillaria borealis]|uniref:Uncharacterized protein n=1 Tax=Armillaria borealis TaxID=47425 RepID=A0AA39JQW5_9AGAR|nr:hypothetical protein EV421DRAFT_1902190 [Armillaria borealis]
MNRFPTIPLLQRLFQLFVTVEEVIPHLVYQVNGRHSLPEDVYERLLVLLFKIRLESYLWGVGHPLASKGELVTTEQWEREKDDPLVQARLLLDAAWALPRPLPSPMWEIRFDCTFAKENNARGTSMHLHTCLGSADIHFTPELANALSQGGSETDHPSYRFFHAQCLRSIKQYSSA